MIRLPAARPHVSAADASLMLASRLELVRYRHVPRFLLDALRLRRLFRHADGAVELQLAAEPFAKTFWTYSLWSADATMQQYVRDPMHEAVMHRYAGRLASSRFATAVVEQSSPQGAQSAWRDLIADGPE